MLTGGACCSCPSQRAHKNDTMVAKILPRSKGLLRASIFVSGPLITLRTDSTQSLSIFSQLLLIISRTLSWSSDDRWMSTPSLRLPVSLTSKALPPKDEVDFCTPVKVVYCQLNLYPGLTSFDEYWSRSLIEMVTGSA